MHFEAAERRRVRDHNNRAWLAWHVAALPRGKRFPALRTLLMDEPRQRSRRQTKNDMLALVKMMNAAMGGAVLGSVGR